MRRKIRVGLPIGSLNRTDSNRGCTYELLAEYGGLHVDGYGPNGKSGDRVSIKEFDDDFEFYVDKPQELAKELQKGGLDFILCGKDVVLEQALRSLASRGFLGNNYPIGFENSIIERLNNSDSRAHTSDEVLKNLWSNWKGLLLTQNPVYSSELNKLFELDKRKKLAKQNLARMVSKFDGDFQFYRAQPKLGFELVGELYYGAVDLHWQTKKDTSHVAEKIKKRHTIGQSKYMQSYLAETSDRINIAAEYPAIAYASILGTVFHPFILGECGGISLISGKLEGIAERDRIALAYLSHEQETFSVDFKKNHFIIDVCDRPHLNESKLNQDYELCLGTVSSGNSLKEKEVIAFGEPILRSSVGLYGSGMPPLGFDEDEIPYLNKRINDFVGRLRMAAEKYGKERLDSRLNPNFGSWRNNPELYRPYLEI